MSKQKSYDYLRMSKKLFISFCSPEMVLVLKYKRITRSREGLFFWTCIIHDSFFNCVGIAEHSWD